MIKDFQELALRIEEFVETANPVKDLTGKSYPKLVTQQIMNGFLAYMDTREKFGENSETISCRGRAFTITTKWNEEDEVYVARTKQYPSISTFGPTREKAGAELKKVLELIVDAEAEEAGDF